MRTSLSRSRVLRVQRMTHGVAMWVDHRPDGDVVYVDAEEFTEDQAQLLEAALHDGSVTMQELLACAS